MNCFLSAELDRLVIGDFVVERKPCARVEDRLSRLVPRLLPRFALTQWADVHGRLVRHQDRYTNERVAVTADGFRA